MEHKKPIKSLNKAWLNVKPIRNDINKFKKNLITLLDSINEKESEEFHKNLFRDFLQNTYYAPHHFINTKGRNDLVVHNGGKAESSVGIIIEVKKPNAGGEMCTKEKLNTKALQELVLYFLRERITAKNDEVKHLVVTNIYEWFIFDARIFEEAFAKDKSLVKKFEEFERGELSATNTDHFYKNIAAPAIDAKLEQLEFTWFDIREDEKHLRNKELYDDNRLIVPYKIFSPQHLLKLPFLNDSNSLDQGFYKELLHIIGLTQETEKGKKLIQRKAKSKRDEASLLENTIEQLVANDKLDQVQNISAYGKDEEEQLFNIALELNITWVNRILFLKLLEAQLISFHNGDLSYKFLDIKTLSDYDQVNKLFFHVLAKKMDERSVAIKEMFYTIPYLNSSLFEPQELEHRCFSIAQLENNLQLQVLNDTVLKETNTTKAYKGKLNALEYLFRFLDAYDFTNDGAGEIQEDNKGLINASVLGLIFEKINGYKDGSFFTPGFITMYMAKETVQRAIVQKFNEKKKWTCSTIDELYNKIEDVKEANAIVNSLKVCDPAVGSGHFLVSVLNEIIATKSYLKILTDKQGKKLRDYFIEVVNDELFVTDEDGRLFRYNPLNKESQRIQETLFHEKLTIIENCLFGVDINPNSVKICSLRLWIELLKNAYYKSEHELETLPNIDINIKCGNSLISRFGLDADLSDVFKKDKFSVNDYLIAVQTYKNTSDKKSKTEIRNFIDRIKSEFKITLYNRDSRKVKLSKLRGEYLILENQTKLGDLFEKTAEKDVAKKKATYTKQIEAIEKELNEEQEGKFFDEQNAFEWRFEFPEVLDAEGKFAGFDLVIGNPPYIRQEEFSDIKFYLKNHFDIYHSIADLLTYFVELSHRLLKENGLFQFIISNKFTRANYGQVMRKFLLDKSKLTHFIDFSGLAVFDEATVDAAILGYEKRIKDEKGEFIYLNVDKNEVDITAFPNYVKENKRAIAIQTLSETSWAFESDAVMKIKEKVEAQGTPLKDWDIKINRGILTGLNEAFVIDGVKRKELIDADPKCEDLIKPLLRGRDIQKYNADFEDLWVIGTFPAKKIDIEIYPSLKKYLTSFGKVIEQSGEKWIENGVKKSARKKTNNKWFETQDSIAYWEDFEKPKMIYPAMTKFLNFVYDEEGYLGNDKIFILTGEQIEWLVCFFNSKLWAYCFRDNFPELLGGTRELRKVFMEEIKVKKVDETIIDKCKDYINRFKKGEKSVMLEIDNLVYELYRLTEEEIRIVEGKYME